MDGRLDSILGEDDVARFWDDGYLLLRNVLSRSEAAHFARCVFDLVPRDLTIPEPWQARSGRLKPYRQSADGRRDDCIDTPELLPLFGNERLYAVAAQLLGSSALRLFDGSVGITLRNLADADEARSQGLHLDASVPPEADAFLGTLEEVQLGGCFYLTDVLESGGGIHVVPGAHRRVLEEAAAVPGGRHLHENWTRFPAVESVEVTGEAGDFALLHHLMPHAASHNRRPTARAALFLRYVRVDHPHGYGAAPPRRYGEAQLEAMSPLLRRLLGVEPWPATGRR